jgi:hypothetical protein
MSREAMKMALEALETNNKAWKHLADSGDAGFWEAEEQPFYELSVKAIATLRQELETEQKPVAWYCNEGLNRGVSLKQESPKWAPLYTAPKQWVGLTDEEIQDLSYLSQKIDEGHAEWFDRLGFYRAVEQALKEKNHG